MTSTIRRLCLAAVLGSSVTLGCERAATRTPPDPLLASKRPVEGKTEDAGPPVVTLGEPTAPMMPLAAVASAPDGTGAIVPGDPERGRYRPRLSTSAKADGDTTPLAPIPATATGDAPPAAVLAVPVSRTETTSPVMMNLATRRQVPGAYGHAADYSWLQGIVGRDYHDQLFLRYCDHTVDDTHGGKVILQKDSRLADFKEGDVILVEGEFAQENGKPVRCTWNHFPHYHVQNVWLVEHADHSSR